VPAAGCMRQLVQSFSSDVQYKRYSPGLHDDSRPAAWLQAETLFRVRMSLISCVTSSQGPGNRSDGNSIGRAAPGCNDKPLGAAYAELIP
jgi:hypothetical protein